MGKYVMYYCLACLLCILFPFAVFADGGSNSDPAQLSQNTSIPEVHTTNILNAHYVIPPKGFNPLTATNAQLKKCIIYPKDQQTLRNFQSGKN